MGNILDTIRHSLWTLWAGGAFVGLMIGITSVGAIQSRACAKAWDLQYQPRYTFIAGCTVVADGKRVPSSQVHIINPSTPFDGSTIY